MPNQLATTLPAPEEAADEEVELLEELEPVAVPLALEPEVEEPVAVASAEAELPVAVAVALELPLLAVDEAVPVESAPVLEAEAVDEPDAVEDAEEEDELVVPSVMLNWFCRTEEYQHIILVFRVSGFFFKAYRLGVDLLGLGAVGEVDGVAVSLGDLAAVDVVGAVAGGDVGGDQDVGGRVGGLVGQVDVEGGLIAGDGIPLDGLLLAGAPDGVGVGRGDLEGQGAGGEGEESQGGDHLEISCW